ncbi:MAG: transposase [Endozoicomonas sp.]
MTNKRRNHTDDFKQHIIAQFRQQWEHEPISVQRYAEQQSVHHTTVRRWLRELDPELHQQLKQQRVRSTATAQQSMSLDTGLKVVTESYQYDEHNEQAEGHPDSMVQQLRHQVARLEHENQFLKKCVAYWTHQAIPRDIAEFAI